MSYMSGTLNRRMLLRFGKQKPLLYLPCKIVDNSNLNFTFIYFFTWSNTAIKKIAEFVMKIYAQSWFSIKCYPNIIYASQGILKIVQCIRYLEKNLKYAAQSTLQINAFMAHPEHLLLGMLFDLRKHIRI